MSACGQTSNNFFFLFLCLSLFSLSGPKLFVFSLGDDGVCGGLLLSPSCFHSGSNNHEDTAKIRKTVGGTSDKRDDQTQPCSGNGV